MIYKIDCIWRYMKYITSSWKTIKRSNTLKQNHYSYTYSQYNPIVNTLASSIGSASTFLIVSYMYVFVIELDVNARYMM